MTDAHCPSDEEHEWHRSVFRDLDPVPAFVSHGDLLHGADRFGAHVMDGEVDDWNVFFVSHGQADATATTTGPPETAPLAFGGYASASAPTVEELVCMICTPIPALTKGSVFIADWRVLLRPYSDLPFDVATGSNGSYWSLSDTHSGADRALEAKTEKIAIDGAMMCRKMFDQPLASDKEKDLIPWIAGITKAVVKLRDGLQAPHPLLPWLQHKLILLTNCMHLFVEGEKAYYGAGPTAQGDTPQLHQRFAAMRERFMWAVPEKGNVVKVRSLIKDLLSKADMRAGEDEEGLAGETGRYIYRCAVDTQRMPQSEAQSELLDLLPTLQQASDNGDEENQIDDNDDKVYGGSPRHERTLLKATSRLQGQLRMLLEHYTVLHALLSTWHDHSVKAHSPRCQLVQKAAFFVVAYAESAWDLLLGHRGNKEVVDADMQTLGVLMKVLLGMVEVAAVTQVDGWREYRRWQVAAEEERVR
ncbi:hypothetical protein LTR36_004917 [Oleoguttula mirabilis]|uniref:Uncharacterized protein n=1 Tax=Oleoguttula mirabilis TaxID=1507867 RepID=A0AAV9JVI3_9PEZI|nr:hypothetical protein LTR36_004917 [Oleoguttula mirabilis]